MFCLDNGILIGIGITFMVINFPQNKLWMNPDSGYLVWTDKQPSGEYIVIEAEIYFCKSN